MIMAERRYNFRFSLPEAFVLFGSLMLTSFLIFLFGVHVGKETQVRKTVQQGRTVRIPVAMPDTERSSLPQTPTEVLPSPVPPSPPRLPNEPVTAATLQPRQPLLAPERPKVSASPATPQATTQVPPSVSANKVVASPVEKKPPVQPAPKGRWSVQVHATPQQGTAQDIARRLREQGYTPVVSRITRQGTAWYRVRVGSFANEEQAKEIVARFRREGTFPQAYPVSE
jgi:septal ring-binding cell division protein DamX